MAHTLRHRGPDDSGIWCDPACGIGLVHTRLAILDLSAEGHQPMVSRSGRYVIVFNGEVYNFQELRSRLEGPWHGHSDTEIVLHAIETWGLRRTLEACLGMFAFAVWDRETRELSLARDRLGVKPLYLARTAQGFAFASELKAIRTLGDFDTAIHRNALPLLLRHGYIPAPHTIYRDAWKLPAHGSPSAPMMHGCQNGGTRAPTGPPPKSPPMASRIPMRCPPTMQPMHSNHC
ncbi:MAG: hypothetical protein WDA11_14300 [Thiohalomonadaceae bacterium]